MKTTKEIQQEIWNNFPFITLLEEYQGANIKIGMQCNNCGHIWKAVPRSVAKSKCGCPKCGVEKQKIETSKNKFLQKLNPKYELIEFINCENVTVKCKDCGNIRKTTSNNILRFGCKHCSMIAAGQKYFKLSQEDFINRSIKIHNNKYDYSKVNYFNGVTKVIIICPEHGEFEQAPVKHLQGQGCPKCSGKNWTKEEFIKYASKVHNNYYDYSKLEWNGFTSNIKIICPKHGEFLQNAYVHLRVKCGCPKCNQSHGEVEVTKCLDLLKFNYVYQYYIKNPYRNTNFCVDFYIEYNNKKYIIEYNGRQHYEPVEKFGGIEQFIKQQERDSDLRKYCNENNINLLEISYEIQLNKVINIVKEFFAVPIEESSELLLGNIGETPEMDNTEISIETKKSIPSYSVDLETQNENIIDPRVSNVQNG